MKRVDDIVSVKPGKGKGLSGLNSAGTEVYETMTLMCTVITRRIAKFRCTCPCGSKKTATRVITFKLDFVATFEVANPQGGIMGYNQGTTGGKSRRPSPKTGHKGGVISGQDSIPAKGACTGKALSKVKTKGKTKWPSFYTCPEKFEELL